VLLTEETITVPAGVIAFISMKTGLKGRGLVNVSGFHVDPGYSLPLRFSVFNAGPSPICVRQGEDSFLIWYADLDQEDSKYTKKETQNRVYARGISSGDVSSLTGPVRTISVLSKKVDELERTQMWMKIFIGVLSVLGTIVLGATIFLAQEGIRSLLSKAAAALGPS
jgi:dCTP deaminase